MDRSHPLAHQYADPSNPVEIDEGVIKYRCDWEKVPAVSSDEIVELTRYRNALHQLNLISQYPNGIGFGNISQKACSDKFSQVPPFIISGTQTAHLSTLTADDYARVTAFNPAQNQLTCKGICKASSESLTHGVIYAQNSSINAVIHVHHHGLWQQLLYKIPTTSAAVPYGTPEMAVETQHLFQATNLLDSQIFAMAGHEEGLVAFGETLSAAYQTLIGFAVDAQIVPADVIWLPMEIAAY